MQQWDTDVLTGPPGAPSMKESHSKCPTMIKELCGEAEDVVLSHIPSCLC